MIRPTRAVIDSGALRANVRLIRRELSPGTRIMAVVKANCYGHGADLCLPELLAEGIDQFAVATVEEGEKLRALGLDKRIVVLAPPLEGQYSDFVAFDLEPFLSNMEMARDFAQVAGAGGRRLKAHLFVDTGLTRDGVAPTDALETLRGIAELEAIDLIGFASHFACSDEPENHFNARQIATFDTVLRQSLDAGFRFEEIHLANSGGIFNFPDSHYTLVRPGLTLYGYHPTPEAQEASGLVPVMALRTVIANVAHVPEGISVSYGRRYYTPAATTIATLPIGYADGLMRTLTGRLDVLIAEGRYPVVGTICMDEVMVDLGNSGTIAVGDEVIVIGRSGDQRIDAWDLARSAGTIPYEICTNISARVPRIRDERNQQFRIS